MKRMFAVLLTVLLLALAAVYYFIPGTLDITETATLNCVPEAAIRVLANEDTWAKWWPAKPGATPGQNPNNYVVNGSSFIPSKKMLNNLEIQVKHNSHEVNSNVTLLRLPHDSSLIKWQCIIPAGTSPFQRISAYREAVALKENMHTVLAAAQNYLSKFENIYGFHFNQGSTIDTALMTTRETLTAYPSTEFIYKLVNKLKAYCAANNGTITGTPMLNITPLQPFGYQVMVALPLQRTVAESKDIKPQKMIPGQFVITEITGGPHRIQETHQQMQLYFQDYQRTHMAIPFEYLVTDRLKEADTSKWITRIYFPVY